VVVEMVAEDNNFPSYLAVEMVVEDNNFPRYLVVENNNFS
jgi:hypothetical protein